MEKEQKEIVESAIVLRISKAGVYVMIKAYGMEGLLSEDEKTNI